MSPLDSIKYLLDGHKRLVALDAHSIRWWPARASAGPSPGPKRVAFDQLVALTLEPAQSGQDSSGRLVSKLKLYYAKTCRRNSAGRLTKLKKLCIEPAPGSQPRASLAALGPAEEPITAPLSTRSPPPSCYASEENSSTSSSLSAAGSSGAISGACPADGQPACLSQLARRLAAELEQRRRHRPKRLLVFVNPFGGKGRAMSMYKSRVRQLLQLADVDTTVIVTKHANHARDTLEDSSLNVEHFDGVVCVGGDGMFAELMNGLLFRYNRDRLDQARLAAQTQVQQPKSNPKTTTVMNNNNNNSTDSVGADLGAMRAALGGIGKQFEAPPVPVGVIGAGSTDANSFGLIGTNDVITATLNIILGNQINIDVCSVHSIRDDSVLRFVSTFVAYGYFGDVIRESEKLRWLGPTRYDITGVNNLVKNRTYKGLVRILVSDQDGTPLDANRCHQNCELCHLDSPEQQQQQQADDAHATPTNNPSRRPDINHHHRDFQILERSGSFVGVNAAVTACRCPQTKKGFSPNNHLANGCADLILVRPCSRLQYIRYLLRTGWTNKSPFDLNYVEAFRCRQFEFLASRDQPASNCADARSVDGSSVSSSLSTSSTAEDMKRTTSSGGSEPSMVGDGPNGLLGVDCSSWNVDGEILNEQSIRVKVNNQLLRVFGTGEPSLGGAP